MSGQSIFLKSNEKPSESNAVDRFIAEKTGRLPGSAKLIFALDATASRGPTWDMARRLTGDMVREAATAGRLQMQLLFFSGGMDTPRRCASSEWMTDPTEIRADDGASAVRIRLHPDRQSAGAHH